MFQWTKDNVEQALTHMTEDGFLTDWIKTGTRYTIMVGGVRGPYTVLQCGLFIEGLEAAGINLRLE
jgi:hypothetical protein